MTRYVLHPDCRVRKEDFGLLFYDLRGPKLLFVESGDLLDAASFEAGAPSADALAGRSEPERRRVHRLLRTLADKGFLREQPIR